MVEKQFVSVAMSLGVAAKIAHLTQDCERALADLAKRPDRRWAWRLEDQRRLLLNPTLRTLVALTTRLAEEDTSLAAPLAPLLAELSARHPEFASYHARVLRPEGAGLARKGPALRRVSSRSEAVARVEPALG